MSLDKLKILIIDDEMHIRLIIRAYLAPFDVEVTETRDGREGLDLMRDKGAIDLVILDYAMPLMSGQEVLNEMLKDEKLRKIPVIVYTAGGFEKDVENRLKTSSTAFMEKSNLGDDLIPTIQEILGPRLKKA